MTEPAHDTSACSETEVEQNLSVEEGEEAFVPDLVNFQTPHQLCAYMVSLIPVKYRRRALVVEPTPGAGHLLEALAKAGFNNVEAPPGDFWHWRPSRQPAVVIGNPPWTPMVGGYAILDRCMEEFQPQVILMLMPWFTIINSERRTRAFVEFGLKSVVHMPRSVFPGARVQCCLLVLEKGWRGGVGLEFYE